jgi:hypothetical protein
VVEGEGVAEAGVSGHYALLMGHGTTRKRKHKPLTVSPVVEEVELPSAQLKNLRLPESAQPWEVLQVRHANHKPKPRETSAPRGPIQLCIEQMSPLQKSVGVCAEVLGDEGKRTKGYGRVGSGCGMGAAMGAGGL